MLQLNPIKITDKQNTAHVQKQTNTKQQDLPPKPSPKIASTASIANIKSSAATTKGAEIYKSEGGKALSSFLKNAKRKQWHKDAQTKRAELVIKNTIIDSVKIATQKCSEIVA